MKLVASIVAALAAAFSVPALASAYWQYYGWLPNGYDRDCLWYAASAQCSGWNYWSANEVTVYSGGPTLNGFENYSTIRGHYTYAGQFNSIGPWDLGMPRYVRAHETNFAATAWVSVWAMS